MVFSINKQAVEIKTRFEDAPLTSPNEVCAAVGMLYKIYGLPLPPKLDTLEATKAELRQAITGLPSPSQFAEKLLGLLDSYYKDASVTSELYDLLQYSFESQE